MPVHAEVTARPEPTAPDRPGGSLRVRPPSPLPPRRRAAIALVVGALAVVGLVSVLHARSVDGGAVPDGRWRALPVPRAARVDGFDRAGPLGAVAGFGSWTLTGPSLRADGGLARSASSTGPAGGAATATATVDAGSSDVLVHAQVVQFTAGSGLVLSASPDGRRGLWLVATEGGWELRFQRGPATQELQSFPARRTDVSVQAIRRGDRVKVSFDDLVYEVDVPPESAAGTWVGLASAGPGNAVELFGYLPLDAR